MPTESTAKKLRAVRGGAAKKSRSAQEVLGNMAKAAVPEGLGKDAAPWEQTMGRALTAYESILAVQMTHALEGDLKAAQFVRDTLGDKPGAAAAPAPAAMSRAERALVDKLAARLGIPPI